MSRIVSIKCPNDLYCGHINEFLESELVGEVPLVGKHGERLPPPPVEIDDNTFVQCEKCGHPISCKNATIRNQDDIS